MAEQGLPQALRVLLIEAGGRGWTGGVVGRAPDEERAAGGVEQRRVAERAERQQTARPLAHSRGRRRARLLDRRRAPPLDGPLAAGRRRDVLAPFSLPILAVLERAEMLRIRTRASEHTLLLKFGRTISHIHLLLASATTHLRRGRPAPRLLVPRGPERGRDRPGQIDVPVHDRPQSGRTPGPATAGTTSPRARRTRARHALVLEARRAYRRGGDTATLPPSP